MSDPTRHSHSADATEMTALVIDDEAMIRRIIRRTLEPTVCRVVEAESAEKGLCMIQQESPRIDLLFTDVHLPDLDGWDVAQVLATYRPELPIVILSSDQDALVDHARRIGARFLPKPFSSRALTALASMLVGLTRARRSAGTSAGTPREPTPVDLVAAARKLHGRIQH